MWEASAEFGAIFNSPCKFEGIVLSLQQNQVFHWHLLKLYFFSYSAATTCQEAGFTNCCFFEEYQYTNYQGPEYTFYDGSYPSSCYIGEGKCYCDFACYFFEDCCSDIQSTCPNENGLLLHAHNFPNLDNLLCAILHMPSEGKCHVSVCHTDSSPIIMTHQAVILSYLQRLSLSFAL